MKRLFTFLTMLSFVFVLYGQERTITGNVIDADSGEPLPGVSIVIQGTSTGVITDLDGNYTVSATDEQVLVFSFIGYLTEEITISGKSTIDVSLVTDLLMVDEIVVVGYGTQKKSLVTGAISKLGSDEIVNTQPQRVEQAIQGKVSGVSVTTNTGSPGGGMTMRIRGTSSNGNADPLFIVDGMRTGGIDYLDPADIESIEILKDAASAAIYGAQGGNGVVLVTTKRGKAGMAQVTYNAYYGQQYYVDRLDVLDQSQYVDYYQKAFTYEAEGLGADRDWDQELIDVTIANNLSKANLPQLGEQLDPMYDNNTDWIDEITNSAPIMSHNLGITGGNDKSLYSGSANYFDQSGITGGDKARFTRFTARLNMEHQANKWLKFGVKATYSHRERSALSENSEFGGTYGNALMLDPLTPAVYKDDADINPEYVNKGWDDYFVRNSDGEAYGMSSHVKNEIINPLAQIENAQGTYVEDKVLAGAFVELEIIEGLKFRTSYDIDVANALNEWWTPTAFYHDLRKSDVSSSNQEVNKWNTWFFDNVLSYTKTFGEHNASIMVGTHAEENTHNLLTGYGKNLVREEYAFSHPASAKFDTVIKAEEVIGGYRSDPTRLASIFGRFTYNYAEKYMLNVTVRNDKSSMLSTFENPETGRPGYSGIFPSVSAGWVVSREDFWVVPAVNFMKLRYSYGENGSLSNILPFQYVSLIGFTGFPYADANGNTLQGASPTQLSNEALTWEATVMHNVGLDFRLFNSKLSGTIEYFDKLTENLLSEAQVAGYVGNNPPDANTGTVKNTGLELELSYKKYDGDFKWGISGNVSFMNNEVTYLPRSQAGTSIGVSGGELTRSDEGFPLWYFYGYETDGLWKDQADIDANNYYTDAEGERQPIQAGAIPGDIKIVNHDTNSAITNEDRVMIGSPHPDVLFGLNFTAEYKGFDLGINLTGAFGNDVYFGVYRTDVGYANRAAHFLEEAWSPTNTDAEIFRPTASSNWNFQNNDMLVENGSYMKLRNVELGYNLPRDIIEKVGIQNLRVYLTGKNLLIVTKYHGADPEMGQTNGEASMGVDRGYYAPARQFLAGINVTF